MNRVQKHLNQGCHKTEEYNVFEMYRTSRILQISFKQHHEYSIIELNHQNSSSMNYYEWQSDQTEDWHEKKSKV